MISVAVNKKASKRKRFKLVPGLKIPCNVTKKHTTAVGTCLRKKVNEVGSAEKLLRSYVCRQAMKKQQITPISKKTKKKKTRRNQTL